jgi:hypothetical protein
MYANPLSESPCYPSEGKKAGDVRVCQGTHSWESAYAYDRDKLCREEGVSLVANTCTMGERRVYGHIDTKHFEE